MSSKRLALDGGGAASSQQGDSDVLYAGERGRAVWMPWTFGPHPDEIHSLGCYHRNLVLATLETESLLALAKASAAKLATDGQLTGSRYDTSRQAVLALGRLYGGSKDATWSSWSVRRQIDDSGQVEAINTLRDYYDPSFGPLRGRPETAHFEGQGRVGGSKPPVEGPRPAWKRDGARRLSAGPERKPGVWTSE